MPVQVHWSGLQEEIRAIESLAAQHLGEASHIVDGEANASAVEIRTAYGEHRFTGRLQDGVTVEDAPHVALEVAKRVRSSSPLAFIFEHGTVARHTAIGADRGAAPAGNVFIPVMIRGRRRIDAAVAAMMLRSGAKRVSGV